MSGPGPEDTSDENPDESDDTSSGTTGNDGADETDGSDALGDDRTDADPQSDRPRNSDRSDRSDRSSSADTTSSRESARNGGSTPSKTSPGTAQRPPGSGRSAGDDSTKPNRVPRARDTDAVTIEDDGIVRWFLKTDEGTIVAIRDVLSSVAVVAAIALLLFGVSGIWPPLVAVESGSMEPNMERGDLVFVVDEGRFVGDDPVDGTGVVTRRTGAEYGHEKFGNPGDVIIFKPNGNGASTPIIHRAHFWVEPGENWVETKANPEFVNGRSCEDLSSCPADYAGFITKGDANSGYDQAGRGARTDVVRPEWITGKAMFRLPWLGYVRLTFDEMLSSTAPPIDGESPEPMSTLSESTSATKPEPEPMPGRIGVAVVGVGAVLASSRYRGRG